MAKPAALEELRALFADNRQHIAVGKITKIGVASDRSTLRVQVLVFDMQAEQDREVVAVMGWDDCGPDAGSIRFPEVNDLVLVAFVDGDPDQCYVIKRLTSKEEKIPLKALDGHSVYQALSGKKLYVASDEGVFLGTPGSEGAENLVLGQVFKTFAAQLLTYLAAHQHTTTAPGVLTTPPSGPSGSAAQFTALKTSPIDNNAILSDIVFTEKG